jgi:ABC-2 type transport system permease protein
MRYLRMFRAFASTEFQFEMEYRGNFYLSILEMFLVIGTSIAAVLVMFQHTTTMNGWTLPQMILLLGVYYLIQGGVNLVFSPSFERVMEHVRAGTLDFHLLKPVNTQFLVSTRHLRVVRAADLVLGLAVVIVGLFLVGESVGVAQALLFALSLVFGVMLVYSLLLGLVTLSFWFVRVENLLAIFWAFTEAGRFPVDVYPVWLRLAQHHRADRHRGHGAGECGRRPDGLDRRRAARRGNGARCRHRERALAQGPEELHRGERLTDQRNHYWRPLPIRQQP